jgi:hypothetical protein
MLLPIYHHHSWPLRIYNIEDAKIPTENAQPRCPENSNMKLKKKHEITYSTFSPSASHLASSLAKKSSLRIPLLSHIPLKIPP